MPYLRGMVTLRLQKKWHEIALTANNTTVKSVEI